jgi:hypothetical protein
MAGSETVVCRSPHRRKLAGVTEPPLGCGVDAWRGLASRELVDR